MSDTERKVEHRNLHERVADLEKAVSELERELERIEFLIAKLKKLREEI